MRRKQGVAGVRPVKVSRKRALPCSSWAPRNSWRPRNGCCTRLLRVFGCPRGSRSRRIASQNVPRRTTRYAARWIMKVSRASSQLVRALIFMMVLVILLPSASYCYRVMIIEVFTRALEVCDVEMVYGSAGKTRYESPGSKRAWELNSALDNVAGQFGFCLVANKPSQKDPMLQVRVAGAMPGLSEKNYAFASDCFPRSSAGGASFAEGPLREYLREYLREGLGKRWHYLEGAYAKGVYAGVFKWSLGCPVRLAACSNRHWRRRRQPLVAVDPGAGVLEGVAFGYRQPS